MAYRKVYFRIRTEGYASGWSSDADKAAFKEESRRLFQSLGWTLTLGRNGGCDTVAKDRQDLYLHPNSFSGVLDEDNIQPLREQLSKAHAFRCYHADLYEEYRDLDDEGYRAELEARRDEITGYILEKCRTKRSNLYVVVPVAEYAAEKFEVRRLCDKDRRNQIGKQFVAGLMAQLLQKGWLGAFFVLRSVHIGANAWFVSESLVVMVIAISMLFIYTCFTIKKGDSNMEQRKNLCAQVPISLHNRVTEAKEALGQTTAEYITNLLTEYYEMKKNGGKETMANGKNRTLAFQIDGELFQRIKAHLERESARLGRKVTQREFVLEAIIGALNMSEPMDVDESKAPCKASADRGDAQPPEEV